MQKVVVPFVAYLQKITQDYETYQKIITKKIDENSMDYFRWKIMNYLTQLSQISYEFSKMGKIYIEELIGPWVMINYILSKDISVHFLLVRFSIVLC